MDKTLRNRKMLLVCIAIAIMTIVMFLYSNNSFAGTTGVTEEGIQYEIGNDGTITITGYTGLEENLVIPAIIEGKQVTVIGWGAFQASNNIKEVQLPNGLKTISAYAFRLSSIESISIPDSVTSIDAGAFQDCKNLISVNIPGGVKTLSNCNFRGSGLKSVSFAEGITEIGYCSFADCSELERINIPESVKTIGSWAFAGCSGLKSVQLLDGLELISQEAFKGCSSLTSISLPDSLTKTGTGVFSGCSSLTNVQLSNGQVRVFDGVFADCTSLTSIRLTNGIQEIRPSAFSGCTSLSSIYIPTGLTKIGDNAFKDCPQDLVFICNENSYAARWATDNGYYYGVDTGTTNGIKYVIRQNDTSMIIKYTGTKKDVVIPDMIKQKPVSSIEKNVFLNCSTLTSVEIPDSVTLIDRNAFANCSQLSGVILPEGLVTIGNNAFNGCTGLTSIDIPGSVESIGKSAFGNCGNMVINCSNNPNAEYIHNYCLDNGIEYCHDWPDWAEYDEEQHFKKCSRCSEEEYADHVWDDGSVAKEPTNFETGIFRYTCIDCKMVRDEIIPALRPDYLPFIDVPEYSAIGKLNWRYEYVKYAYENNLVTGDKDVDGDGWTTFRPNDTMARGDFMLILYRMAGEPEVNLENNPFTDVKNTNYDAKAIIWAYEKGIVSGYSDGTFHRKQNITRQEIAKMLKEYAAMLGKDVSQTADISFALDYETLFSSKTGNPTWSMPYMQWAYATEIITGAQTEGGIRLNPKQNATRAECCKMLKVFCETYMK